jgi:hypothetical protein
MSCFVASLIFEEFERKRKSVEDRSGDIQGKDEPPNEAGIDKLPQSLF